MPKPGRYRILRKIADGGMAEIFLASQRGAEGFERPVVLKRILAALVADPQFRHMMIDEAHVAMSLNHSNIVQVLDLGHAKGRYFLVLEFVDGWDLNQILNRVKTTGFPIPPEIALYVCAEVCRALSYAHGKIRDGKALGIVHRDVSPHNVLVSEQGEVKLTDFGIAKAFGRRERTGQGVIKGKLAFMSPEQASGLELDARSDLFSVGTMLYLMATGRRPFEAPTDLEAILRVRQCDFPPPAQVRPEIAPRLAEIILRAMKQDPAGRYQTAEEMLIDIESVQRSAFQPAGQTELKRWLAELQQRDGVPPIGRSRAPSATETDADLLELVDGEDLVFEDSKADVLASGVTVAERHRPPTAPTIAAPSTAPPPFPPQPAASMASAVRPPRRRLSTVLLIGGAGAAGWLYFRRLRGPDQPVATAPEQPAQADAAAAAAPHGEPDAAVAVQAPPDAERPLSVQPTPPDAAADATETPLLASAPDGGADALHDGEGGDAEDQEEEEEALLKRAEPDAAEATIAEEDSVAPPPTAKPISAPRPRPAAAAKGPPSVSVRIATKPEGAVIRLKGRSRSRDRVFGRAPMSLRFSSGQYYELSFVKSGYQSASKRFYVSSKKNQKVVVSLRKKAAPKKRSLFQRIFGGR